MTSRVRHVVSTQAGQRTCRFLQMRGDYEVSGHAGARTSHSPPGRGRDVPEGLIAFRAGRYTGWTMPIDAGGAGPGSQVPSLRDARDRRRAVVSPALRSGPSDRPDPPPGHSPFTALPIDAQTPRVRLRARRRPAVPAPPGFPTIFAPRRDLDPERLRARRALVRPHFHPFSRVIDWDVAYLNEGHPGDLRRDGCLRAVAQPALPGRPARAGFRRRLYVHADTAERRMPRRTR
jgi:hypothetical protein